MGRIVVGVDGSQNSRAALDWAVGEAELRGARLEAVMAWHVPYVGGTMPVPIDAQAVHDSHRAMLDRVVDGADIRGLEQPVERILVEGSATHSLIDAAAGAELLVVGNRGHGGFIGLLLGSVSQQVVAHAPCPVVIVPSADDGES